MRLLSPRFTQCLAVVAVLFTVPAGASDKSQAGIRFSVDVAEDFSRFVLTDVNQASAGQPVRGSWFLTDGRIFRGGTIQGDGAAFDPGQSGSIGTWHCRGTHVADFDPANPIWVLTSQLFLLPGLSKSLATDGLEGSQRVVRVVTGGTGMFKGYVGEQHQQFLGFNATGGVNLRVTFILRKAVN